MRFARPLTALAALGLTAACATSGANYVPVVDGPVNASFQSDLAACQQLAAQQGALSSTAGESAAAGAVIAGGTTAVFNNRGTNVAEAAALGAAAGLTASAVDQQRNKEQIIRNCMRGRGHNVVG
ncbi:MAG: glycine zipper family protein [Pseudomonadota bacterium]